MSLPNLAGNWFTQMNAPFPDGSTALGINNSYVFMLKEMLKGTSQSGTFGPVNSIATRPTASYWTVVGSSDGTVTGALDGIDRLTGSVPNSYDPTKLVHSPSGTAGHSWIVLKSPQALGPTYCCIDLNSATSTTFGVVFSKQPFVISPAIPNETGSRPITNNGWIAGSNADPIQSSNVTMVSDNASLGAQYRAHFTCDISGNFQYAMSRDGTGLFSSWLALITTVDQNPNDTVFNTFALFNAVSTGRGTPAWGTVGGSAAGCSGRVVDGSVPHSLGGCCGWTFGTSAPNFNGVATPDVGYTTNRVLPIYIQTLTANKMSWRGRVPDMWLVGNPNVGDGFPNQQNPTQVVVGDILAPFSVVPIL